MKPSRYTDQKAATMIGQVKSGVPMMRVCCEHGISTATYYKWRSQYFKRSADAAVQLPPIEKQDIAPLNQKHDKHRCKIAHPPEPAAP